jgi:hypothetical protein
VIAGNNTQSSLIVIPAKAEALYNSEAGQSSSNTQYEALLTFLCCVLRTPCLPWIPAAPE